MEAELIAFALVCVALAATPGPDMFLVLHGAISAGRTGGLAVVGGILCGLLVHATLAILGLSAVLVGSARLFTLVKIAGAAYLIFLGVRTFVTIYRSSRAGNQLPAAAPIQEATPVSNRRWFIRGLITNILNPKVVLMYVALLPQFASTPSAASFAQLALIQIVIGCTWMALLALAATRVRHWLARPRIQRVIDAVAGTAFVSFGARLATVVRPT